MAYSDPYGASGIVGLKGHVATIHATLVFYGPKITIKMAQAIADEIQGQYNKAHGNISLGGQNYQVKVRIHYQIKSEADAYEMAKSNTSVRNNFIRVDDHIHSDKSYANNRSEMAIGGNTAYFVTTDNLGYSTTATHEFTHGLGLTHYNERTPSINFLGRGQPGIMAARGTPVDPPFRLRLPANPSYLGIDATKRVVLEMDVQDVFKNAHFNSQTKRWEIGQARNGFYKSDSDKTIDLNLIKNIDEAINRLKQKRNETQPSH